MRKIGICYGAYKGIDVETHISLMKKHGFETTFIASEDPAYAEIMKRFLAEGILCESMHAPWRGINSMWREGEAGEEMLARLICGVERCAEVGVPVLVVHLSSGLNPPPINELGRARFTRLMDAARTKGVKIAYENQRMRGNLGYAFDIFPDAVFCWDTGHEECFTGGRRYMPMYGGSIAALHVHDNHCEFNADEHMLPFDGKIDFERVARSLAEADYDRSIMLEVSNKHPMYAQMSADDFYARAAVAARKIADRVEELKQASL